MHRPLSFSHWLFSFFFNFDKNGKSLDPHLPNWFMHISFSAQITFFASVESAVHSLLFRLTCLLFDPDKKGAREPPGGFSGYDVTSKILGSFGKSQGTTSCNQRHRVTLTFTHLCVRPTLYFPGSLLCYFSKTRLSGESSYPTRINTKLTFVHAMWFKI